MRPAGEFQGYVLVSSLCKRETQPEGTYLIQYAITKHPLGVRNCAVAYAMEIKSKGTRAVGRWGNKPFVTKIRQIGIRLWKTHTECPQGAVTGI